MEHVLTGQKCWCNPRVIQVCTECDETGCLLCVDDPGWVTAPEGSERSVVIIHHDIEYV